jgi:flagellar hook-associated protein 3 FlgL
MLSDFYPVIAGRVSDSLSRYRSIYQLQADTRSIQAIQEQLSTGRRVNRPSDDPTAAIHAMGLQRSLEFQEQALLNLKSGQAFLNVTESTLSEAQNLINDATAIGLGAIDSTLSPTERAGLASQLDAILQRMITLGNTKFQDRYLLAGGLVGDIPLEHRNDGVRFSGNDLNMLAAADRSDRFAHNVTGQTALGVMSTSIVSTVDLNPGIGPQTRLDDLNGGTGIAAGVIEFSDGTSQTTIDISGSATVLDVVQRINASSLGGRALLASIVGNHLTVDYQDNAGGTLRISDIGIGSTAKELGIATSVPLPILPIQGGDLDAVLRLKSTIASLNDGAGFNMQGGIEISQAGRTFRVELATATTIEDIVNRINQSGAAVVADVTPDGRALRVRSIESGTDFSIGESDGDLATRLGLRTFNATTRLTDLNYGRGLNLGVGTDIVFQKIDGTPFSVNLDGAITVQDAIDRINLHVDNLDPATKITASLNVRGNGITLTSTSAGATAPMKVRIGGGSEAAWHLGFVPFDSTEVEATLAAGVYQIVGSDTNPQEIRGVYNTLVRLKDAVRSGDTVAMERAGQLLVEDGNRLAMARGELGVRQQRIDRLQEVNREGYVEMRSQESETIDADLAQVISDLQARQAAQEASLRLLGYAMRKSLFDYL